MHADHQVFLDALRDKRQLTISFFDKKENKDRTCTCAPLDFGPLRGQKEPAPHYQLWDMAPKKKPYNITVLPEDVKSMTVLDATFDPGAIITWNFKPKAWAVERDWEDFS